MARTSTKKISVGLLRFLGAFLFVSGLSAQDVRDAIGPIEKQANPITPENPIPRRISLTPVDPAYPPEAAAIDAAGAVSLVVTIDNAGRVVEMRKARDPFVITPHSRASTPARNAPIGLIATPSNSEARAIGDALLRESAAAVRRWHYDPPAKSPLAFTVTFSFRRGGEVISTQGASIAPSSAPAIASANQPVRVGSPTLSPPTRVKVVQPRYPPAAVAAKAEGIVILEAWIGVDGRVIDVKVLRSIPLLDHAALDAVRQWEYAPTILNGVPTPVAATATVVFNLSQTVTAPQ